MSVLMTTHLRSLIVVLTAVVAVLAFQAPAQAVGSQKGCRSYNYASTTNDWGFFYAHKIRVFERSCIKMGSTSGSNYPWLKWTARPKITLPSKGIPSTETVRVTTQPYVQVKRYFDQHLVKVRWGFSVRSCSLDLILCNDFDFTFHVRTFQTTICVEKGQGKRRCDAAKPY